MLLITSLSHLNRDSGLYINVVRPANISADTKLPVLVVRLGIQWFVSLRPRTHHLISGSTEEGLPMAQIQCEPQQCKRSVGLITHSAYVSPSYSGTTFVERSIQLGEPVIWVAMNYR